jgi:hypothetical protein
MEAPAQDGSAVLWWLRRILDRSHLRGLGTTLGVFLALPFGIILGLILGSTWANHVNPDWADTVRWGGLLAVIVTVIVVGGVIGTLVGGGVGLGRWADSVRMRVLIGALTGALVYVGPAALLGWGMEEMAPGDLKTRAVIREDRDQQVAQSMRSWATAGLLAGGALGALLGLVLKKPSEPRPPLEPQPLVPGP